MNGLNRRAGLHDLVKLEVELGWASLDWATWIEFQYVALRVGVEISLAWSFIHTHCICRVEQVGFEPAHNPVGIHVYIQA